MLTTNMIRKDISTHNQYDASLALNGLACFMTLDLARWVLIRAARPRWVLIRVARWF